MLKRIVIFGRVLHNFSSKIAYLIKDAGDTLGDHEQCIYPERYLGPQQVIEFVRETIELGYPCVFLTREGNVISEFVNGIRNGIINSDEVQFWLVQYTDKECEQIVVSKHMIENGQFNNDWPFGKIA